MTRVENSERRQKNGDPFANKTLTLHWARDSSSFSACKAEQLRAIYKMEFTIVHVDGGAFTGPPDYKFTNAYFSVLSSENKLVHFEKNIGDVWSGVAEYRAIEWAIKNINARPLKIFTDCTTAISWAKKGKKITPKIPYKLPKLLNGSGVIIEYRHDNYADRWNAENHSPKRSAKFYIERHRAAMIKTNKDIWDL